MSVTQKYVKIIIKHEQRFTETNKFFFFEYYCHSLPHSVLLYYCCSIHIHIINYTDTLTHIIVS